MGGRGNDSRASDALYRLAFDAAASGLGLLDSQDRWLIVNPAMARLLGPSASALVGMPADRLLAEVDGERLRGCLAAIRGGGHDRVAFAALLPAGAGQEARQVEFTLTHPGGNAGEAILVNAVVIDRAEAVAAAPRGRDGDLALLLDRLPVLVAALNRDLTYRYVNAMYGGWFDLGPADLIGRPVRDVAGPDAFAAALPHLQRALSGEPSTCEVGLTTAQGERIVRAAYVPGPTGDDGRPDGIFTVITDITELKELERRQRVMTAEMAHRIKNILGNIQAIVQQTALGESSKEQFVDDLVARIGAIARTHGLLGAEGAGSAAMARVVADEVAAYAPGGAGSDRVRLVGPDVRLKSKAAMTLTLVLHELATNAAKYGAFTDPAGQLCVAWRWDKTGENLLLEWKETLSWRVAPPARKGFGTDLVECSIAFDLAGTAELRFDPHGIVCNASIPGRHVDTADGY